MISERHIKLAKATLLSGFFGGLWGACLEVITEATSNHLMPQLINIVVMATVGLYVTVKVLDKIEAIYAETAKHREENKRLRAELKAFEAIARTSLPEWPEASENHPRHDAKSA